MRFFGRIAAKLHGAKVWRWEYEAASGPCPPLRGRVSAFWRRDGIRVPLRTCGPTLAPCEGRLQKTTAKAKKPWYD